MSIVISCVLDGTPQYLMQCWNLIASLNTVGATKRAKIIVHTTPSVTTDDRLFIESLGAHIEPISLFGDGARRYCNKLQQLNSKSIENADYIILCDTDILFTQCPTVHATGSAIKAKIVDLPNPPLDVCQQLLARASLPSPAPIPTDFSPTGLTLPTNCNGGLYIIPAAELRRVRESWRKWSEFCLDQADVLGPFLHHSDQLGFALATLEGHIAIEHLPSSANFPTHFPSSSYSDRPHSEICAFHYHERLDASGFLIETGVSWIDSQIQNANLSISEFRRTSFNNKAFWNYRYAIAPDLGSGVGSRGAVLNHKRQLLEPYILAFRDDPILDVGCGDLETTRYMEASNYLGIDRSESAIVTARTKRPDWRFQQGDASNIASASANLTLCLDLLIHQPTPGEFQSIVADLVRISKDAIIVSGYEEAPFEQGIVFFHEPLSEAFNRHPDVREVVRIGQYRDVTLFLVTKTVAHERNKNDIKLEQIAWGVKETPFQNTLHDLINLSRSKIGFFPNTIIRTLEYPWFARNISHPAGKKILDVGAGVNVLPFWFTERGATVSTIDLHSLKRNIADIKTWNEWGYLDYSKIDKRINSTNGDIGEFVSDLLYDFIYSVSVLEHMPAEIRRNAIAKIASLLVPGGKFLLSVDLVPNTELLWPLSEGNLVDQDGQHGNIADLMAEVQSCGLNSFETTIRRNIPGSRTDLLFLIAEKTEVPSAHKPAECRAISRGRLRRQVGAVARLLLGALIRK